MSDCSLSLCSNACPSACCVGGMIGFARAGSGKADWRHSGAPLRGGSSTLVSPISRLDLRLVRAFVKVAQTQSVSRAADQLGYSQPAVSQQIREMERLVGQQLFRRGQMPLELTPAGRDRLVAAQLMLMIEGILLSGDASPRVPVNGSRVLARGHNDGE